MTMPTKPRSIPAGWRRRSRSAAPRRSWRPAPSAAQRGCAWVMGAAGPCRRRRPWRRPAPSAARHRHGWPPARRGRDAGCPFGAHLLDKSTEAGGADLVAQGVGIVGLAERAQLHGKADAAGGRCCRRGRGRCRLARGGLRLGSASGFRASAPASAARAWRQVVVAVGVLGGRLSLRTGLLLADGAVAADGVLALGVAGAGVAATGALLSAAASRVITSAFTSARIFTACRRRLGLCTVGVRPHAHTPCLTAVDGGRFCEARQLRALQVGNHGIGVGLAAVGAEGDGVVAGSNRREVSTVGGVAGVAASCSGLACRSAGRWHHRPEPPAVVHGFRTGHRPARPARRSAPRPHRCPVQVP